MIITEIQIDSFGGLCGKHLYLKEGVNIIYGNKESGKSTVSDFIRFIFYGVIQQNRSGSIIRRFPQEKLPDILQ